MNDRTPTDEPPQDAPDEVLVGAYSEPEDDPDTEQQLTAANDRILRLQAELQNQITRQSRQLNEERRYAALPLMRDLLPALDNVDRALEAAEKSGQGDGSDGLLEGVRLVRQQLATTLAQHQCESIDATGQVFDPDYHEAILQQPSNDTPAGHVIQTVQTGYRLHDRVVRASQVIVSSGPPDA